VIFSVHGWLDLKRWIACVLLLVLPACANLAHRFPPSVPPAASGIDPALDAQTRLIESAHRAFLQERYPLASALFQRFVDSYPDSPRLSEARWSLARSYELGGDLQAALTVYRAVIAAAPRSSPLADSYEFHALNRLDAFRRSLGSLSLLERRQIALWLTRTDWLTVPDIGPWLAQLAEVGVTTLILDAGPVSRAAGQSGPMGVYFQTSKVPVVKDLFAVIVPAAHARGIAVLASLNLHETWWMTVNPDWSTLMIGSTDQVLQRVGSVDVLHPDYQRLVGEVAQDLLQTDIDGLVVGARRTKGFAEEWSPTSRQMFVDLFGSSFDSDNPSDMPNMWRWAGWKTRTYLGFIARLAQRLRQTRPGLLMAVAVHERAAFFPVDALTDYGEDVFETKQRGLHLVVKPELGMSGRSDDQGARLEAVRQRLAPTPGNERQLWLGLAISAGDPLSLVMAVRAALATNIWPVGAHLLLMNGPVIP